MSALLVQTCFVNILAVNYFLDNVCSGSADMIQQSAQYQDFAKKCLLREKRCV